MRITAGVGVFSLIAPTLSVRFCAPPTHWRSFPAGGRFRALMQVTTLTKCTRHEIWISLVRTLRVPGTLRLHTPRRRSSGFENYRVRLMDGFGRLWAVVDSPRSLGTRSTTWSPNKAAVGAEEEIDRNQLRLSLKRVDFGDSRLNCGLVATEVRLYNGSNRGAVKRTRQFVQRRIRL